MSFFFAEVRVDVDEVDVARREHAPEDGRVLQGAAVIQRAGASLTELLGQAILVDEEEVLEPLAVLLTDVGVEPPVDVPLRHAADRGRLAHGVLDEPLALTRPAHASAASRTTAAELCT